MNFSKLSILSIIIFNILFFRYAIADNLDNGNRGGGNFRICTETKENSLSGIYFYDYLQAKSSTALNANNENQTNSNINTIAQKNISCDQYNREIIQKLKAVNPMLGFGFEHFINEFGKESYQVYGVQHHYKFCNFDDCLENQKHFDPAEEQNFPKNCTKRVQIAVRDDWDNKSIAISINQKALHKITNEAPEQCSYFYIHEWLRDFITDTKQIEKINYYIHSNQFLKDTNNSDVNKKIVELFDFDINEPTNNSVISNTINANTELTNNPCTQNNTTNNKTVLDTSLKQTSDNITNLKDTFVKAYMDFIKNVRLKMPVAAGKDFLPDFETCINDGYTPSKYFPLAIDFQFINDCFSKYAHLIKFEKCTELANNSSTIYLKSYPEANKNFVVTCLTANIDKITSQQCLETANSQQNEKLKKILIKYCDEATMIEQEIKKYDPYRGKLLTTPIKKSDRQIEISNKASKISEEMYKQIVYEAFKGDKEKAEKFLKERSDSLIEKKLINDELNTSLKDPSLRTNSN